MAGFFDTNPDKFEYCPGNVPAGRPSNRPPGRGVPDVSLYSFNFAGLTSGKAMAVGGTSASSPMFGGLLLLLHACLEDAGADNKTDLLVMSCVRNTRTSNRVVSCCGSHRDF